MFKCYRLRVVSLVKVHNLWSPESCKHSHTHVHLSHTHTHTHTDFSTHACIRKQHTCMYAEAAGWYLNSRNFCCSTFTQRSTGPIQRLGDAEKDSSGAEELSRMPVFCSSICVHQHQRSSHLHMCGSTPTASMVISQSPAMGSLWLARRWMPKQPSTSNSLRKPFFQSL